MKKLERALALVCASAIMAMPAGCKFGKSVSTVKEDVMPAADLIIGKGFDHSTGRRSENTCLVKKGPSSAAPTSAIPTSAVPASSTPLGLVGDEEANSSDSAPSPSDAVPAKTADPAQSVSGAASGSGSESKDDTDLADVTKGAEPAGDEMVELTKGDTTAAVSADVFDEREEYQDLLRTTPIENEMAVLSSKGLSLAGTVGQPTSEGATVSIFNSVSEVQQSLSVSGQVSFGLFVKASASFKNTSTSNSKFEERIIVGKYVGTEEATPPLEKNDYEIKPEIWREILKDSDPRAAFIKRCGDTFASQAINGSELYVFGHYKGTEASTLSSFIGEAKGSWSALSAEAKMERYKKVSKLMSETTVGFYSLGVKVKMNPTNLEELLDVFKGYPSKKSTTPIYYHLDNYSTVWTRNENGEYSSLKGFPKSSNSKGLLAAKLQREELTLVEAEKGCAELETESSKWRLPTKDEVRTLWWKSPVLSGTQNVKWIWTSTRNEASPSTFWMYRDKGDKGRFRSFEPKDPKNANAICVHE